MSTERMRTRWITLHAGLFLAALGFVAVCLPGLGWPWYLVLPLAGYGGAVLLVPALYRTAPRLAVGRLSGARVLVAGALSIATSAVLLTYQAMVQPDLTALGANVPVAAFGNLVLAGLCFSVANAALEELVFRGVLYDALAAEWGAAVAVGVTAAAFGIGHVHGYPPGPPGAALAGAYGVALGLLRWWTGGLGLPVGCHVCADAAIFGILASSGVFAEAGA
jgi:membrane protease YdiL (CAAX protease family)